MLNRSISERLLICGRVRGLWTRLLAIALVLTLAGGCRKATRNSSQGSRRDQVRQGTLREATTKDGFYRIASGLDWSRIPLWFPFELIETGGSAQYHLRDVVSGRVFGDPIVRIDVTRPGLAFGVCRGSSEAAKSEFYFLLKRPEDPQYYSTRDAWAAALARLGVEEVTLAEPKTIHAAFANGTLPGCSPPDAWENER